MPWLRHDDGVTLRSTPALVTQGAATGLPRWALLLFCAAYVLPGVIGRDPWRNADLTAFGQMLAMAEGRASWLAPALGEVATGAALLPHWLGAASIALTQGWLEPSLAARIPFALLLALSLAAVWFTTRHLASSPEAQPVAFAFGGEASVADYARAVADASVLAMMATLGLLQLGHETTPELAQLAAMAGFQWSLSAQVQARRINLLAILMLTLLAASGAPTMATSLGMLCALHALYLRQRHTAIWLALGVCAAAGVGVLMHTWGWRLGPLGESAVQWPQFGRLLLWFLWPTGMMALWALWRWRARCLQRHLAIPLCHVIVALVACLAMGGNDRPLMLGLPAIAVLAAFALPTLSRSTSAAMDWFSVCFFTLGALAVWIVYASLVLGWPEQPSRNIARLAPGFSMQTSLPLLGIAIFGSAAWIWLVRWRTGRHQPQLWKSLVLPAGGVALGWLLLMSLWLPLLDYARSQRPLVDRLRPYVGHTRCVWAPLASAPLVAALEYHGPWRVVASAQSVDPGCSILLQTERQPQERLLSTLDGWVERARVQRPTERNVDYVIYRRRE